MIALGLLAVATCLNLVLDTFATLTSQAMAYVLAVVIASYMVSRLAAVLTAISAVLLLNFFFIDPRYTLEVDARENTAALLAMLAVALVISHLAAVSRREAEAARLNAARAQHLQELATELANVTDAAQACALGQCYMAHAFAGTAVVAHRDPAGHLQIGPEHQDLAAGMEACVREAAVLGPGTGRWPGLDAWYLPLKSERYVGGAACVLNVQAADTPGLEHAQAISSLVGQALQRLDFASSAHAAEVRSQWHRAQNTFLAAVSHDFRTPLASIMAGASALQMQRDKLPAAEQEKLLASIIGEAGHLATLTENTLQLVRLENAGELVFDWQSIEEIVGAVLARFRARSGSDRIQADVPADLPLVKGDPVLLAQLLENLLENALKYSTGLVELRASRDGAHLSVAVKDRGPAMAPGEAAAMFEPFRRGDSSAKRGTGLGLAVCRAIATAHGGELIRSARAGGGSSFVLRLPVEEVQPLPEGA